MSDQHIKTSAVSIPSVALATMAIRKACHRVYQDTGMAKYIILRHRGYCDPQGGSANAEYYRIIDRLSAGEVP